MQNSVSLIILIWILTANSYTIIAQDNSALPTEKEKVNSFYLWRGFHHEWTYNHRINRLGDIINQSSNDPHIIHTGASGSGKDILKFTSYYTEVNTNDGGFFSGNIEFDIREEEGVTAHKKMTIAGSGGDVLSNFDNFHVVLNGFDLYSSSDVGADKLYKLKIKPENLIVNPETGNFTFELNVEFGADCNSIECNLWRRNQVYEYHFTIGYGIISCNENIEYVSNVLNNEYGWNKRKEIFMEQLGRKEITQQIDTTTKQAQIAFAIENIDVEIETPKRKSKAYHLLALNLAVHPSTMTDEIFGNEYPFWVDMFFKHWTKGMHTLAYRKKGYVNIESSIALIKFNNENTKIAHHEVSGNNKWLTKILKPSPATNTGAVVKFPLLDD